MFFVVMGMDRWCDKCRGWYHILSSQEHSHATVRRVRSRGVIDGRSDQQMFSAYLSKVLTQNKNLIDMFSDFTQAAVDGAATIAENYRQIIDEIYNPDKRVGISAQESPYGPKKRKKVCR